MNWLVNLIPTDFMLTLGVIGIVAFILMGRLPFLGKLAPYRWVALILGALFLVLGIFLKGAEHERTAWELKVKEAEAKVAVAEEKARNATAQVETVFVDRVKEVVKTRNVIQEKIVVVTEKIDQQCKLDPVVIDIHNAAALNQPLPEAPK